MKYLGLIPLLLLIAIVPAFASEPLPEIPPEPVTSSIGVKSANDNILIGQQTNVNVTFFNLETLNAQEHVDYTITILKSSGESIFNSTIIHTSTGVANFPVIFPEFDR